MNFYKIYILFLLFLSSFGDIIKNDVWKWLNMKWSINTFIYAHDDEIKKEIMKSYFIGFETIKNFSSNNLWSSTFNKNNTLIDSKDSRKCWILKDSSIFVKIFNIRKKFKDIFILPTCLLNWELYLGQNQPILNRILCWKNKIQGLSSLNILTRPKKQLHFNKIPLDSFFIQRIYLWDMQFTPVNVIFYFWKEWNILRNGSREIAYKSKDLPTFSTFQEFANDFNFKVCLVEGSFGPGVRSPDGNWTGELGLLVSGHADISLTTNAPTAALVKKFRIVRFGGDSHARLFWRIIPYEVNTSSFISVFSLSLWIALVMALLFVATFIRFYNGHDWILGILFFIASISGQGPKLIPRANKAQTAALFSLLVVILGWLFIQFYCSGLMAALTTRISPQPPSTFEEMVSSSNEYHMGIFKGTRLTSIYMDSNNNIMKNLRARFGLKTLCEVRQCFEWMCTGKTGILSPEAFMNYPLVRNIVPCKFVALGPYYFRSRAGLVLRKDFILADALDWWMLRLYESGRLVFHRNRFYRQVKIQEDNSVNSITIEQIVFPYLILIGGMFLSLICLILEKL